MNLTDVAAKLLDDARPYLEAIDQEVYSLPQDLLFGASIGQHTRHFLEFYECLLTQLREMKGRVDYAQRKRDMEIESDPEAALEAIDSICTRLGQFTGNPGIELQASEYLGADSGMSHIQSNFQRELLYNIEHTIHHLAIIKIGLAVVAPDIELPENFGVAPSTVLHRKKICAR